MTDSIAKGRDLVKRVESLAKGLAAPDEIDRARTLLAELEQTSESNEQQWRVASARLTRVLRLNPANFFGVTIVRVDKEIDGFVARRWALSRLARARNELSLFGSIRYSDGRNFRCAGWVVQQRAQRIH